MNNNNNTIDENRLEICKGALEDAEREMRWFCALLGISADGAPQSDVDTVSEVFLSLQATAERIHDKLDICIDALFPGDAEAAAT